MLTLFWFSFLWLLAVYLIYPLVIRLVHRFHSAAKRMKHSKLPKISLIIPCYNEENAVQLKILNTLKLKYPRTHLQIIFIDDASNDATLSILRSNRKGQYKVLHNKKGLGKSSSLAKAAQFAKGEIIVFSDCTAQLERHSLIELVKPFSNPKTGLCTGVYQSIPSKADNRSGGEGMYWKMEMALRKRESDLQTTTHATGAFYAIRSSIFHKIHFEEDVINDDLYIPLEVLVSGYNVISVNSAKAKEYVDTNIALEWKRRVRIASGNLQMMRMVSRLLQSRRIFALFQLFLHKWLRNLGGFAVLIQILTSIILFDLNFYGLIAIAWFALFLLGFLGYHKFQFHNKLKFLTSFPLYFLLTNAAGVIGFTKLFNKKNSTRWEKTDSIYQQGALS